MKRILFGILTLAMLTAASFDASAKNVTLSGHSIKYVQDPNDPMNSCEVHTWWWYTYDDVTNATVSLTTKTYNSCDGRTIVQEFDVISMSTPHEVMSVSQNLCYAEDGLPSDDECSEYSDPVYLQEVVDDINLALEE